MEKPDNRTGRTIALAHVIGEIRTARQATRRGCDDLRYWGCGDLATALFRTDELAEQVVIEIARRILALKEED